MEYFQLINVQNSLLRYMTKIENWRYYSYCSFVLDKGSYLGKIDHFPDTEHTLKYLKTISNSTPIHLPQNKLCKVLLENIALQENYEQFNRQLFNTNYIEFSSTDNSRVLIKVINRDSNKEDNIICKYLVGCDGANSDIRKQIGSSLIRNNDEHHFINFHFKSNVLAEKLRSNSLQSMLYFILNEYHITVLIAYDFLEGDFVLQIPFYPPIQTLQDFTKERCKDVLIRVLSNNKLESILIDDIIVLNISSWRMRNAVADKLYDDKVFLIGDSAHQFPPSGGYGLNTGIFDTMNIFWRIVLMLKGNLNVKQIIEIKKSFERECTINSNFISKCAQKNFEKYLNIINLLGLKTEYSTFLKNAISNVVPKPLQRVSLEKLFSLGLYSIKFKNVNLIKTYLENKKNHLNLLFPYVDYCLNYFNQTLNDLSKYEEYDINYLNFLQEGHIIPNLNIIDIKLGNQTTLRNYLRSLIEKEIFFFMLIFKGSTYKSEEIRLFNDHIGVSDLNVKKLYFITNSQESADFLVNCEDKLKERIEGIAVIIIRPDFIIQRIVKN